MRIETIFNKDEGSYSYKSLRKIQCVSKTYIFCIKMVQDTKKYCLPWLFSISIVIRNNIIRIKFDNLLKRNKNYPRSLVIIFSKNLFSNNHFVNLHHLLRTCSTYIPCYYSQIYIDQLTIICRFEMILENIVWKVCCCGFRMLSEQILIAFFFIGVWLTGIEESSHTAKTTCEAGPITCLLLQSQMLSNTKCPTINKTDFITKSCPILQIFFVKTWWKFDF